MAENIGKLIKLPQLPNVSSPKGFEAPSSMNSFLLSKERFSLYEEIEDFVSGKSKIDQSAGFVPSGPHGMGKSGIGLLLSCYAFVNGHILIYIPKCSEWLAPNESTMAIRFLEIFRNLNADIAATIHACYSKRTLLQLVNSTNENTAIRDMAELFDTLKTQEEYAVFYIFDEHNEIYRKPDGGTSPLHNHPDFLNRYTQWTGPTGGVLYESSSLIFNRSVQLLYTLARLTPNLNSICQEEKSGA
jgi:hypothetical protein